MKTRFTSASKVRTLQRSGPSGPPKYPLHRSCRKHGLVCSVLVRWSHSVSDADVASDDLGAVRAITLRDRSTFEQSAVYQIGLPSQATESWNARDSKVLRKPKLAENSRSPVRAERADTRSPNGRLVRRWAELEAGTGGRPGRLPRGPPDFTGRRARRRCHAPLPSFMYEQLERPRSGSRASVISLQRIDHVFRRRKSTLCSDAYLRSGPAS